MILAKIYPDPEALVPVLDRHRSRGETIVFANGCFELLHVGHIRYLAASKEIGDVLIVAVNTDESMRMIKPEREPVNPDHERFEIIAALGFVDYVVPLRERRPDSLLELLRPNVQTKGTDYTPEKIPERVILEKFGGRVEIVGDPKDHSTTEMLEKLRRRDAESDGAAGRAPDQRK